MCVARGLAGLAGCSQGQAHRHLGALASLSEKQLKQIKVCANHLRNSRETGAAPPQPQPSKTMEMGRGESSTQTQMQQVHLEVAGGEGWGQERPQICATDIPHPG